MNPGSPAWKAGVLVQARRPPPTGTRLEVVGVIWFHCVGELSAAGFTFIPLLVIP